MSEIEIVDRHEPFSGDLAEDMVNSPKHYAGDSIECIDAMVQQFGIENVRMYAKINSFKYLWRCEKKGKPKQDLEKAAWYLLFANGHDPREDK